MTKQQRKQIEREFYNYKLNRDKAANYVASHALDGLTIDYSEPRVKSSPGNTMENKLIKAIDEEDLAWRWYLVYEKTMERFYWTQKDELMRRRYEKKEHETATCMALCIARSTYFAWTEEIMLVAFMWAKELSLL